MPVLIRAGAAVLGLLRALLLSAVFLAGCADGPAAPAGKSLVLQVVTGDAQQGSRASCCSGRSP